jgi:hypothetical protein
MAGLHSGQIEFNYPTYEVILPQSGTSVMIRSLQVSDEEKLKLSLASRSKFNQIISEVCWSCMVKPEETYKDFNTFMKTLTLKDREALLFGVYHSSYGSDIEIDTGCTACGTKYSTTVDLPSIFSAEPYTESTPILEKVFECFLPVSASAARSQRDNSHAHPSGCAPQQRAAQQAGQPFFQRGGAASCKLFVSGQYS